MALPWAQIVKGGSKVLDGQQSGGSGKAGGGKGGILSTIGQRANMPLQATMGLATGAIQGIQAMMLKKKADAAFPELVDPNQAGYMSELNQKRKSIETGADFAEGMKAIDTTNAATNDAITRNTGGDVGGTIQALLQSERAAGDSKDNVLAQGQSQQFNYDSAYGNMVDKIAARKMQLQMVRSQQLRAQWDQKAKAAGANLAAGVAGLMEQKQDYNKPIMGGGAGQTEMPQLGAAPAGNGLNVADMMKMTPKADTGLSNVPSAPSATPIDAPKVVPKGGDGAMMKNAGPIMDLIKR